MAERVDQSRSATPLVKKLCGATLAPGLSGARRRSAETLGEFDVIQSLFGSSDNLLRRFTVFVASILSLGATCHRSTARPVGDDFIPSDQLCYGVDFDIAWTELQRYFAQDLQQQLGRGVANVEIVDAANLRISLSGSDARALLEETITLYPFDLVERKGSSAVLLIQEGYVLAWRESILNHTVEAFGLRLQGLGVAYRFVDAVSEDEVCFEIEAIASTTRQELLSVLGPRNWLEFRTVFTQDYLPTVLADVELPAGVHYEGGRIQSADEELLREFAASLDVMAGHVVLLEPQTSSELPTDSTVSEVVYRLRVANDRIEAMGDIIQLASTATDPDTGLPYVAIDLTADGRNEFCSITTEHVGESLALVQDGVIINDALIVGPICDGHIRVQFGESDHQLVLSEATRLVNSLNSEPLPAPVSLRHESQIYGPRSSP